ncbi:MAG: DUF1330 domain-containing protein [Butyricicoccus sp.]
MACYFVVDTYIDETKRGDYDEYIREVKPIVETYGGEYLVRTENVFSLNSKRIPQREIIIRFDSREALDRCFQSKEYQAIQHKRMTSVDSRAIIVDGK